ncbi:MAG: spore germination protein [Clostridia bacterium]
MSRLPNQRDRRNALIHLFEQVSGDLNGLSRSLDRLLPGDREAVGSNWRLWEPHLRGRLGGNADIVFRVVSGDGVQPPAIVVYVDNLVDPELLETGVIKPLQDGFRAAGSWNREWVSVGELTQVTSWPDAYRNLFDGQCLLILPPGRALWAASVNSVPHRSVDRPQTELVTRGPQEGFTELLALQMAQLRHAVPSPDLRIERLRIGERASAGIGVAWLAGLANDALVAEVKSRLQLIRVDMPLNATRISAYLRDRSSSIFPTVRASESVAFARFQLQNGKVLILVDGDPFVLSVPAVLADFYRTPADHGGPWYDASFVRILRLLGWAMGVFLPGMYVALTELDPRVISPALLILLTASHTGLPFNPIVEVLFMILSIELLREAAIRLPSPLGATIGTVGAIVVGTAVVKAGFVSAQIIVVMTLAALSFFTAPVYELTATWRVAALVMLIAAFLFGLYGIVLAALWLIGALMDTESFGMPYLVPYVPFRARDFSNTVWRVPWVHLQNRLSVARAEDNQTASPPDHGWDPGLQVENKRDDEQ